MNLTSNWNINSIGKWTNVLVPAGLTSYKWGIQGPPEPVHFMCTEISPPGEPISMKVMGHGRFDRLSRAVAWATFSLPVGTSKAEVGLFATKPFILLHQFFLRIYQNPLRVVWVTFRYKWSWRYRTCSAYVTSYIEIDANIQFHRYFRFHLYRKLIKSTQNWFWLTLGKNWCQNMVSLMAKNNFWFWGSRRKW